MSLRDLFTKEPDLSKYPLVEELIEEAEKTPHQKHVKNVVPELLEPLKRILSQDNEVQGKRVFNMSDIESASPLYAHELKKVILEELINIGFKEKELKGHQVRFGKKISYNYYFLNLRDQAKVKERVQAVIENKVNQIEKSELSVIDFASIIRVKGEDVVIFYELILGVLKINPVTQSTP